MKSLHRKYCLKFIMHEEVVRRGITVSVKLSRGVVVEPLPVAASLVSTAKE